MLTLAEVNARRPRCLQCGCLYDLIEPSERAEREVLLAMLERAEFPQFVQALRSVTGCGVGEAKATYLHLTKSTKCHRCEASLPLGTVVDCPKCKALNLCWRRET
jgi:hypothetical protein